MNYPLLALSVIGVSIAYAGAVAPAIFKQRATWLVLAIMLVLTLIFDALLVHIPIVQYADATLSGFSLWGIPIEDFSYTLATVFISISCVHFFQNRNERTS
jgi:lycopene cyclase domain-containing protein